MEMKPKIKSVLNEMALNSGLNMYHLKCVLLVYIFRYIYTVYTVI